MGYVIAVVISFAAGFAACWIYRSRAVALISKERDALRASAQKIVSKI